MVSARPKKAADDARQRLRLRVRGAVQGVGFRPFVYRLATSLGLNGWVNNTAQGVFVEVEGERDRLHSFLLRLEREKPPRAFIQSLESSFLDPVGYAGFKIRRSEESGSKTALILPDVAVCNDCLREVFDPANRRHLYPFTNCTNCGPRFSIIEGLPYDRPNTTMKAFAMCEQCLAEYEDPLDRRFHAQPNACPACGPRLELVAADSHALLVHWATDPACGPRLEPVAAGGNSLAHDHDALLLAADALRCGLTVAVKGLGGFHLMVDARRDDAVKALRQRKHREEKPFAVMFPTLDSVESQCEVADPERRLLLSPESPIVLLRRRASRKVVDDSVAPGNPNLGALLPYTPLHHLLMAELGFPIVATSGNLSDEPICIDESEALNRLRNVADLFLVHNRPIARHVDDSIVRVMMGREIVLRRARGYAPLPVPIREEGSVLAVGAHLKNTIAVSAGSEVFVSQHIGDLETPEAFDAFQRVITSFRELYELKPRAVACDLHPDYLSSRYAHEIAKPLAVQHHYAHILSCMADNEIEAPVLGVAWDGTGLGTDGTIWGGEFLRVVPDGFQRVAHLRTFRLPGGDKAMREPRRSALGLLFEAFGSDLARMDMLAPVQAFAPRELDLIEAMLARGVNSPVTSSAGRLFDAVAALAGLRQYSRFEGQAAMELEFSLARTGESAAYPVELRKPEPGAHLHPAVVDWEPLLHALIRDVVAGAPPPAISARFHNALVESIVLVARRIGEERIALSGGCFQNRYLTERTITRLREEGFRPYWHQRVPPNDGGIALGQAVAGIRAMNQ